MAQFDERVDGMIERSRSGAPPHEMLTAASFAVILDLICDLTERLDRVDPPEIAKEADVVKPDAMSHDYTSDEAFIPKIFFEGGHELTDLIERVVRRMARLEAPEPEADPPPFTPSTTERGFTVKTDRPLASIKTPPPGLWTPSEAGVGIESPDPPPVEPDRWALHEQLDPARCFDECEPPKKFPWSIFQTTTHAKGCPVHLSMLYDHPNALLRKETGCRACWGRYQDGPGSELIITHSEHCPNS